MKKDTEFQEIGKKIPYKVPEGFFDELSLKTLAEAKKRSESRRKFRILWQSVAVAASLTGLAFLGYYFSAPEKAVVVPVVAEQPKVAKPQVQEVQPEKMAEPQIVVAEKIEPEPNPEVAEENSKEDLSDLLAGLSDDDLLQMAAMIKTDPFMEEVPQ
ncbi:MAG: hypothetical protein WC384_03115 [Prolixibacteraceae bacterium]